MKLSSHPPTRSIAHPERRYIPADIRAAGLAQWTAHISHTDSVGVANHVASASRTPHTASRVLHEVAHPLRTFRAHHKRKAEDPPRSSSAKKQRAGGGHDHSCSTDDAPHAHAHAGPVGQAPVPDPGKVLKIMRLGPSSLK